jgi:hypothetical protein
LSGVFPKKDYAYFRSSHRNETHILSVRLFQIIGKNAPAVLILMAVDAEIFPVGAVRRIVLAIAVLMMDCQQMPVLRAELSSAFGTDEAVNSQGLVPVIA